MYSTHHTGRNKYVGSPLQTVKHNGNDDDATSNDDIVVTVTREICVLAVPCRQQHDSSCPEENT